MPEDLVREQIAERFRGYGGSSSCSPRAEPSRRRADAAANDLEEPGDDATGARDPSAPRCMSTNRQHNGQHGGARSQERSPREHRSTRGV